MTHDHADTLRKAIVNLINAKLYDALATPGGLMRLVANRTTGVASADVRNAERQLQQALSGVVNDVDVSAEECAGAIREAMRH
jgi:hypothetical protein